VPNLAKKAFIHSHTAAIRSSHPVCRAKFCLKVNWRPVRNEEPINIASLTPTHYTSGDLPKKKTKRLAAKLNQTPELVVFEKVSDEGACSECGVELLPGDFLLMEKGQPLCLACADLDRLVFLPAGDTALSRRARRHSSLATVVVRFSRARKRYERQGLLVTEEGLAKAEEECTADASARAAARGRAALARQEEDHEFVTALTQAILQRYPSCPADESRRIAEHTGCRRSGRVGRSAVGKALEASAVDLAVIAHIRQGCYHPPPWLAFLCTVFP